MSALSEVRRRLEEVGLLMMADAELPSVTTMVAGEAIRGSWWSHPAGGKIFAVLEALDEEAAFAKLVDGKVTVVARRLCPALATVGAAREPWQLARLRDDAADVLALVDEEGEIRSDDIELSEDCRKLATIVTDLERRLLLIAEQVHTDQGKHVRVLRSWARWESARSSSVDDAKRQLRQAALALGGDTAVRRLPWPPDA